MSNKILFIITSSCLGFFAPLYVLILWMFGFVLADFITGIWAAKKYKIKIESRKLRKSISKTTLYMLTIVLLHAIDTKLLPFGSIELGRIGTSIICGIELYSIFENAYKITKNRVFHILTQFTLKKIEDVSGIEIDQEQLKKDEQC